MTLDELITKTRDEADGDGPLDLLSAAARQQQLLADLGDELLDHFVHEARQAGCSWAQIGAALGVTKQAAQQRHTGGRGLLGRVRSAVSDAAGGLFTRFDPQAREAVVLAQEEARQLGHRKIDTEHVLLGVLGVRGSPATEALRDGEVDFDALRADLVEAAGPATGQRAGGHIPFTGAAKKALELALRQALSLHADHIGTEHLLLGLLTDDSCTAAVVLARHGVTLDPIRDRFRTAG